MPANKDIQEIMCQVCNNIWQMPAQSPPHNRCRVSMTYRHWLAFETEPTICSIIHSILRAIPITYSGRDALTHKPELNTPNQAKSSSQSQCQSPLVCCVYRENQQLFFVGRLPAVTQSFCHFNFSNSIKSANCKIDFIVSR